MCTDLSRAGGYRNEGEEYGPDSFSIKHNNTATNDPCAVCGDRTDPRIGPELFLGDSWVLVCRGCAHKYAPVLLACLDAFRDEYEPHFGACPECGREGVHVGIHKTDWFVCHADGVLWLVGAGLFSGWREETEEDWERRAREIEGYRKVEPLYRAEDILAVREQEERRRRIELFADFASFGDDDEDLSF